MDVEAARRAVLDDLVTHKLPAMAQAGLDVDGCGVLLVARSGFSDGVRALAASRADVELVDATRVIAELEQPDEPGAG